MTSLRAIGTTCGGRAQSREMSNSSKSTKPLKAPLLSSLTCAANKNIMNFEMKDQIIYCILAIWFSICAERCLSSLIQPLSECAGTLTGDARIWSAHGTYRECSSAKKVIFIIIVFIPKLHWHNILSQQGPQLLSLLGTKTHKATIWHWVHMP